MTKEDDKMPFLEHLDELRKRMIICFLSVLVCTIISYSFKEKIFQILSKPFANVMGSGSKMIFTGPLDAIITYIKISFLSGIILAIPVILYEFWMFIAPGLYDSEKRLVVPIVFLSSITFFGGCLFGYYIVFPFGLKFLLGFASENITPMISMKEYFSFFLKLSLALGAIFELPLILTFLAKLGIISSSFLSKNRKYAILLIFITAGIITPGPDVFSQVIVALPLMLLYEISILGAKIFGKKRVEDISESIKSNPA